MLERRHLGDIPPKPHTVFKVAATTSLGSELVFTRDGFSGGFSILYSSDAPTAITSIEKCADVDQERMLGQFVAPSELPLARRHIESWRAPAGKDLLTSRTALMRNASCRVSAVRGKAATRDYAFCNGDADELYFVFQGSGTLLSLFGSLSFKKNDYVLIPRGVPYAFDHGGDVEMFLTEGLTAVEIPGEFRNPFGQLKLEAPYTHRDFASPRQLLSKQEAERFANIVTLRNGGLTRHRYSRSPAGVVGWDGSVYPMTFGILDYLPKTGKIHLPPNLHMTFKGPGFVVCSFVPRLVDYQEGAVPCPYPHANVDCDEILYYVSGDFTSRSGIKERSISYHPAGMPHGPQPGRYHASVGAKATNELAVMVDTWETLSLSRAALASEDVAYQTSWKE